jgi:transcriptional regulator with XRE-family HTH domain
MTDPLSVPSPPVARRRVARCFREMRLAAGLTLEQAAVRLDLTRSGLHRLESGGAIPHVHIARSMMDLYDQYLPDLLDTIRASRRRGWWQGYRVSNRDYIGWEAGAALLREVAVVRLPDLLQTAEYAHELLAGRVHLSDEIAARRIRQDRLNSLSPLRFAAVLDESALRNSVGDARVMRDQLAHVVECAAWPTVQINVLPASAGARVRTAGFRLLAFDHSDDEPIVYADCAHATVREDDRVQVGETSRVFDAITSAALTEEDSVAFIQDLSQELYPSEKSTSRRKSA